ncbi:MAG: hypothetical protein FJ295_16315 [Planctomycetes bacterium]|nr:hypothetical protein [Planctomycetota bacterium]
MIDRPRSRIPRIATCCLLLAVGRFASGADELILVERGQPVASIHAPGENLAAGARLSQRVARFTGAQVEVHGGDLPPQASGPMIVIGCRDSNPIVRGFRLASRYVGMQRLS